MYHQAMEELIEGYFESGRFEEESTEMYNLIRPYVYKDPTFFYTTEEFENEYEDLKDFCMKRAERFRGQLDGE